MTIGATLKNKHNEKHIIQISDHAEVTEFITTANRSAKLQKSR
jgi:hypothetical protein